MSNEEKEMYSKFKRACIQSYKEQYEKLKIPEENIDYSDRHKKRINRIPRKILGTTTPIYPEVDNAVEQIRSKIVYWWNKRTNNGGD